MRLKGKIIEIGTYNEGYFKLQTSIGDIYTCYVSNLEKWDKLYDYMNEREITVTVTTISFSNECVKVVL